MSVMDVDAADAIAHTARRRCLADSVAKVFLRYGTQILRAVGAAIE